MAADHTIEIDLDLYVLIESHRRSFGESPEAILRRLLGLEPGRQGPAAAAGLTVRAPAGYHTIDVDVDLHRLIEARRGSFADTPNDVLRRLLGLAQLDQRDVDMTLGGGEWSGKGVSLPAGTQLRMTYNGQTEYAEIRSGAWWIGNKRFFSPSGAASAVARTKQGSVTKLTGWRYWEVKRPGDHEWMPISRLRSHAA
jgi:hypothetical protein